MSILRSPYPVLKFDAISHQLQKPTLLLKTRGGKFIDVIDYDNLKFSFIGNELDEISFDVHKNKNGKKCACWDKLIDLAIIDFVGYGQFEAHFDLNETNEVIKSCVAESLETELGKRKLYDFHINDEFYFDTLDETKATVLYDEYDEQHSLLNKALSKAPQWSIAHVDSLFNVNGYVYEPNVLQRQFTINGNTIYDFFHQDVSGEFGCIFFYDTYNRDIYVYNLNECVYEKKTLKVVDSVYYHGGLYYSKDTNQIIENGDSLYGFCNGVGQDTTVYISNNKLSQSLSLNSDKGAIKNCFYVKGGDDLITNYIATANVTGNNYIYMFDNFQYEDMSDELVNKFKEYQDMITEKSDYFYKIGGIYIPNEDCIYDTQMGVCRDSNGKILTTAIYQNDKVYVLDTCAYMVNDTAYDKDDNVISDYIYREPGLFTQYSQANDRYYYLNDGKFPNTDISETTAQAEYNKIKSYFDLADTYVILKNSYSGNGGFSHITNTVRSVIESVCDSRYSVEILNSSEYPMSCTPIGSNNVYGTWKGYVCITRETDDEDDCIEALEVKIKYSTANEDVDYIKQKMNIAIASMSIVDLDFTNCTSDSDYINFFKRYNLTSLKGYMDAFQSCLDTLIDLYASTGLKSNEYLSSDTYKEMKNTYQQRYLCCKLVYDEVSVKVSEIKSQVTSLSEEITLFRESIDMKTFFGSDELWNEFQSYIREDEYSNSNYISDGLSDSELLENAKELLECAKEELSKACVIQKTVSGNINNLFALKDLETLYESFALFNYVRCNIDDVIYKLRLIQIDFDSNSPSDLNVVFSEQIEDTTNQIDYTKSILEQAASIATTYSSTEKQANQGATALSNFTTIKNEGLSSADYIIKNSDNEEVTMNRNGVLLKSMNDTGIYGNHQTRLTGNGLYLTSNAWDTVDMAVGLGKYNGEWKYGVWADVLVGNIIAGENLNISTNNSSVVIDEDGLAMKQGYIHLSSTTDKTSALLDPLNLSGNGYVFRIGDKNDNAIFSVDKDGNGILNGNFTSSATITGAKLVGTSGEFTKEFNVDVTTQKILDSWDTSVIDSSYYIYMASDGNEIKYANNTDTNVEFYNLCKQYDAKIAWVDTSSGMVTIPYFPIWGEEEDSTLQDVTISQWYFYKQLSQTTLVTGYNKILINEDELAIRRKSYPNTNSVECGLEFGDIDGKAYSSLYSGGASIRFEAESQDTYSNINIIIDGANSLKLMGDSGIIMDSGGSVKSIYSPYAIFACGYYDSGDYFEFSPNGDGYFEVKLGNNKLSFNKTDYLYYGSAALSSDGNLYMPWAGNWLSNVLGGKADLSGATFDIVYSNNWFRSHGQSGWYNESYGGGIWMADSSYLRIYNSKTLLIESFSMFGHIEMLQAGFNVIFRNDGTYFYILPGNTSGWTATTWYMDKSGRTFMNNGFISRGGGYFMSLSNDQYFRCYDSSMNMMDGVMRVGSPNYRVGQIYSTNAAISTSDRNQKNNINELEDKHIQFIRKVVPVSFEFKDGTSGRTHIGFIAQDIEEAMNDCGLTDLDFAGFCKDKKQIGHEYEDGTTWYEDVLDEDGNIQYIYSLRYEEFIALNTNAIQHCMDRLDKIEELLGGMTSA